MSVQQAKVKSVQSGDTLVLAAVNNSKQERILSLAYTTGPRMKREGDEPFAFESRDYLRRLTVGKIVKFQILYDIPNPHSSSGKREHGRVILPDGIQLPERLVSDGWLKLRDDAGRKEDTDEAHALLEKLRVAEAKAKSESNGIWATTAPKIIVKNDISQQKEFVEEHKGKEIDAIVERVLTGDRLFVRLLMTPTSHQQTILLIAGIRAPSTKRVNPSDGKEQPAEPYGDEAQEFIESRLLQRNVKVILVGLSGPSNQPVGIVKHPNGSIADFVLREGLARCHDFHSTILGGEMAALREAEKVAKEKKLGQFKGITAVKASRSGNIEAVVARVQSGDTLYLRNKAGGEKKINLSSVRQPKPTDPKQGPWVAEAKEALRKKIIGKHVRVTVDGKRPPQDGYEEREMATIMLDSKNIGLWMVENGWASVVRHRRDDDDRSPIYDELLLAEEAAQKDQKGMWSAKKFTPKVYTDISSSPVKAKSALSLLSRQKRIPAVVDFVKSAARFTVLIPREDMKLTLVLGGIRAPKTARNASEESEPFGQEAYDLANRRCLQRDIAIDIDDIDKAGGFIGTLWIARENFAKILVEEGFATVHGYSAEKSSHGPELWAAQNKAKESRKALWKDWDPSQDERSNEADAIPEPANGTSGTSTPRPKDYRDVVVTHVDSTTGRLKVQQIGDGTSRLEKLMGQFATFHNIKANSTPISGAPKTGDFVSAKFSEDNQWYRARIRSNNRDAKQSEVVFIDYGNSESTPWTALRPLPAQFSASVLRGQAMDAALSFIQFPSASQYLQEAVSAIFDMTNDKQLVASVDYEADNTLYITLFNPQQSNKALESYNADIVAEGLALVPRKPKAWEKAHAETLKALAKKQEEALKERRGMFEYGDVRGDED